MKWLSTLAVLVTLAGAGCATSDEGRATTPYAGMTVNERLAEAGLFEEWDKAVRARDRDRMVRILQRVDLGELAHSTADRVLADPERYGYFAEDGSGPPRAP